MKRYFANTRACNDAEQRRDAKRLAGPGIFEESVALIGAGMIGRHVIRLLQPFALDVLVVDPYLPADKAERTGRQAGHAGTGL
jgi:phosphoglycerate dehydrogenase-like enzyme